MKDESVSREGLHVVAGDCAPSQSRYFVRISSEEDGWDVHVYDGDDRDDDLSASYCLKHEAVIYTMGLIKGLCRESGTVAILVESTL